ncbi:MAG TPA: hypothetical protein VFL07_01840 [Rudaea sp.]|nr:hypothetical protein [Rudaea sp.]
MNFYRFLALVLAILLPAVTADSIAATVAQSTAFTYQGQLNAGGTLPAGQTYQFTFTLYDAASGGNVVGAAIPKAILVGNGGLFTTDLDFGQIFNGRQYWLDIQVGTTALNEQELAARQPINAVPVAQYALKGGTSGLYTFSSGNSSIGPGTYFIGQSLATSVGLLLPGDFPNTSGTTIAKFDSVSLVVPASGTLVSFTACLKGPDFGAAYNVYLVAEDPSQTTLSLLGGSSAFITLTDYARCGTFNVNSVVAAGQTIVPWAQSTGSGFNNGIAVTATFIAN